jgi:hypothetical protein
MTYTHMITAQKKATTLVAQRQTTAAEQKATVFARQKPTICHVQKDINTVHNLSYCPNGPFLAFPVFFLSWLTAFLVLDVLPTLVAVVM